MPIINQQQMMVVVLFFSVGRCLYRQRGKGAHGGGPGEEGAPPSVHAAAAAAAGRHRIPRTACRRAGRAVGGVDRRGRCSGAVLRREETTHGLPCPYGRRVRRRRPGRGVGCGKGFLPGGKGFLPGGGEKDGRGGLGPCAFRRRHALLHPRCRARPRRGTGYVRGGGALGVAWTCHCGGEDRVVHQGEGEAGAVRSSGCRVRGGGGAEGRGMSRGKGSLVRSLRACDRIVGTVQAEVHGWGLTTGGNHRGQDPFGGAAEDHTERGREACLLLLHRRGGGGHDLLGDRRAGGAEGPPRPPPGLDRRSSSR